MIYVNADGGSRGNPGLAAIGAVVSDAEHNVLEKVGEKIGVTTNNVAEYKALIKGLELALKYTKDTVHVQMDSEVVIRHMTGEYKVSAKHLKPLYETAKVLEREFRKVTFESVPRHLNHLADELVNLALDS